MPIIHKSEIKKLIVTFSNFLHLKLNKQIIMDIILFEKGLVI